MNYLSSFFYKPIHEVKDDYQDLNNLISDLETNGVFKTQHKMLYKNVMKELLNQSVYYNQPEIYQYIYGWVLSKGELEYYNGQEILTIDINNDDEYKLFNKIESKLNNPKYYVNYLEWFIMSRKYIFFIQDRHMINLFKNDKYNSLVTKTKYFCRGFFEGSKPNIKSSGTSLTCKFNSYRIVKFFKYYIEKYYAICGYSKYMYTWYDMDALTFLGDLYNRNGNLVSSIDELLKLETIVDKIQRAKSLDCTEGCEAPQFICNKLVPEADYPYKNSVSDIGFTVKLLDKVKEEDGIEYFTTGLQIYPDYGYYFEIYGNDLYKYGYTIATGGTLLIENIDNEEIVVPLRRNNNSTIQFEQLTVKLVPKKMCLCDVKSYQSESESVSELKSYITMGDDSMSESNESDSDTDSEDEST